MEQNTEAQIKVAKRNYDMLCSTLDAHEFSYEKDEEKLIVQLTVHGDDIPMDMLIFINPERELITLYSRLPFTVAPERVMDMALATSLINDHLPNGSFDFSDVSCKVVFRLCLPYMDSLLGKGAFEYLLFFAANLVDAYNDKLLMIAKGMMDYDRFKEMEMQENEADDADEASE